LEVELLDPSGEVDNCVRVARGEADFSLSRVAAFLTAAPVAARYVAVLVGRSPICAFVPASSAIQRPDQLSGRRVGGAVWAMSEFVGAMSWLGLPPASVIPMSRTSGGGLLQ
jgi:ABC-type nitrate/sulfonate/bicarbonate transport system substrate-binding protein